MNFNWADNFEIEVKIENNRVIIWANKDGLVSLANYLLEMTKDQYQSGYHFHLD